MRPLFAALITIILFSTLCVGTARAQVIKGGLISGFNLSQIDGDEVYGYKKFGFHLGAAAIVPVSDRWSLSIENLFAQKGSYEWLFPEYNDTADFYYRLKLSYVEVPLLIHFEDRETITFGTGFSYSRLVGAKELEYGVSTPTNSRGPYSRYDINWLLDVRFRLNGRLKFNFRYAYSLAPIRTRHYTNSIGEEWDRQQYNNLLTFRLIYVFNEKQSAEARRDNKSSR